MFQIQYRVIVIECGAVVAADGGTTGKKTEEALAQSTSTMFTSTYKHETTIFVVLLLRFFFLPFLARIRNIGTSHGCPILKINKKWFAVGFVSSSEYNNNFQMKCVSVCALALFLAQLALGG